MKSQYIDLLKTALNAINTWQQQANSAQTEIQQINIKFPDGSVVVFSFNSDTDDWTIDT